MRREVLVLEEMIDAAEQAHGLVAGISVDELSRDRTRRDALFWNFTVLGETVSQLPDTLLNTYPAVPWRQPQRLRNRIVHGYWSIDLDIVHATAQEQLPGFVAVLKQILAELQAEDSTDLAPGGATSPDQSVWPP